MVLAGARQRTLGAHQCRRAGGQGAAPSSTDVWALPYVPRTRIPGHLVEAALRAIVWETAHAGAVVRIGFERLRLLSDGLPSRIVGKPHEASFAFVDDSNAITHTFEKITVQSRSSQNRKVATA